jgi:DNA-binding beta-propeller fold protein YncE
LQAAGLRGFLGMWANPVNGHLISSSNAGLVDIDPIAGTFRVINAGLFPDGVSVSPDGKVAYVENVGSVQSYDIATGALIRTFATGHRPDGTGVIFGGPLNGRVIVNDNDGTVGLLDPTKKDGDPTQFIIIASGGTRGDFVSPDTSNGTLLLSQLEQVVRLSCGPGCIIGSVPEPQSYLVFVVGLASVLLMRARRVGRRQRERTL